ncbi:MAG: NADH-quinone oxidoreductase subunit L [Deltaproteobacteria bacterium]|nr:NADH-quinone oxidoreductase subunit L [Deltaproteobacteria bacterium]
MDIWALLVIPLIVSVFIALVTRKNEELSSYLSIGAVVIGFLIVLPYLLKLPGDPHMHPIEQAFTWISIKGLKIEMGTLIDPLSIIMLFVVTFVGSLIHIYSKGYMHGDPGYSRFFACLSLFIFSMLGIVLSNNLIMIFVFWELVGLASYLLIGYYFEKPSAADAAKKAFLVNRIGDFGFILGIFVIYYATGTFNFIEVEHHIAAGHVSSGTLTLAALLIFCGAVGKSAQFPLHVWLPDAMEGPTPVSALIHAATMVAAGVYMLARTSFLYAAAPDAMVIVAYIGGFTALMAALIALAQSDIKRIIAFSTLSSLGYMVLAIGVGGTGAGMFYLMTHAFFKALLFLGAGSVIHACHTNEIWEMGQLYPKMKTTAVTFFLGSLAMMGVFPFSGFWSKDEILSATFQSGNYFLFAMGILTAFITAVFISKLVVVTFFGDKKYHGHPHESPKVMTIPLIILSVFAVVAGFAGFPGLEPNFGTFVHTAGAALGEHGAHAEHHFNFMVASLSTIAVLGGILLGWSIYSRKGMKSDVMAERLPFTYKFLENRFYIDHIYDTYFVAWIYNGLAKILNYIEVNIIIIFIINGSAYTVRQIGKGLRLTTTGQLQNYAFVMVGGVLVLMIIFAAIL